MADHKKRIILAKIGLDGHDNGVRIVSMWLADAGYEVIYAGLYNTPEGIVRMALEEDVNAIGVSFLGGEHLFYARRFTELLAEHGMTGVKLVMGGVIPPVDVEELKGIGVHAVFTPGTRREVLLEGLAAIL